MRELNKRNCKRVYKHLEGLSVLSNFSNDGQYRYMLEITEKHYVAKTKILCVIMQNPSCADENIADKSINFLEQLVFKKGLIIFEGVNKLIVVNLFSYIQKIEFDGDETKIGSVNNSYVESAISQADIILLAWGNDYYTERINFVIKTIKQFRNKLVYKTAKHPSRGSYSKDFILEYSI